MCKKGLPAVWTKEKIEEAFAGFVEKNRRLPVAREMKPQYGLPTRRTFERYMDTTAQEYAELRYPTLLSARDERHVQTVLAYRNEVREWSIERLMEAEKNFFAKCGRLPEPYEYTAENGLPMYSVFCRLAKEAFEEIIRAQFLETQELSGPGAHDVSIHSNKIRKETGRGKVPRGLFGIDHPSAGTPLRPFFFQQRKVVFDDENEKDALCGRNGNDAGHHVYGTAFAAGTGDVAGAIEGTWTDASAQIKTVVNNVVFPVIDLVLAVFFFAKLGMAYFDYRKHGQFEWTAPAILFACLIFTLTAPTYVWTILGM